MKIGEDINFFVNTKTDRKLLSGILTKRNCKTFWVLLPGVDIRIKRKVHRDLLERDRIDYQSAQREWKWI